MADIGVYAGSLLTTASTMDGSMQHYLGDEDGSLEVFNVTDFILGNHSDNASAPTPTRQERDTPGCKIFKFVLYAIAMAALCILGFAGNTLSFLVLRKDMSTPVASFLLEVLAIADNVLLILWLIHYSVRNGAGFFTNMAQFDAWIYTRVYTFPVMYMAQTATIWLTVVIALNRYMAVCLPYRAPHLCNINNVYKGVAAVILFSVLYNVPRFFEIQILHLPAGNETWQTIWKRTALGSNETYNQVYTDAFYYLFSFVLPLLTLAYVNTRVTIAYQAIRRRKRRMTSRRQENENNITLVMIIIVLIFMLCQAPARIVQIIWGYRYKHCHSYQFYLIHISNTLEVLNSSVNFLVYFMFRKRFRDIVYTHFCIAPISRLKHRESERAATTEGLSLVQIEQTTATMMIQHETTPATVTSIKNATPATKNDYNVINEASNALGEEQQPLNGSCTKAIDNMGGAECQVIEDINDESGDLNIGADSIPNSDSRLREEVAVNGMAATEPCIQNNNDDVVEEEDDPGIEDAANVPLHP